MLALSLSDEVFAILAFSIFSFSIVFYFFVIVSFSFSLTNSLFSRFSTFSFSLTKITLKATGRFLVFGSCHYSSTAIVRYHWHRLLNEIINTWIDGEVRDKSYLFGIT